MIPSCIVRIACAVAALHLPALAQCNSWSQNFQSSAATRQVEAMEVYGGAVHVLGIDTAMQRHFARFDGAQWTTLPAGPNGPVRDATVFDDGGGAKLYVVGEFFSPGFSIAQWTGTSWAPVTPGLAGVGALRGDAAVVHDDGSGPALFVGGRFSSPAPNVARWNGTSWSPLAGGLNGEVLCLAIFDEGSGPRLFAGGVFNNWIARWDGIAWTPVGAGPSGVVGALTVHDDGTGPALYAGINGTPNVQRWDGTSWTTLAGPSNWFGSDLASFDDGTGPALYTSFSTGQGFRLTRWNGSTWTALPGPIYGTTRLLSTPRELLLGGPVVVGAIGSLGTTGLAAWNGTLVRQPAAGDGMDGFVQALCVHDDGSGPALYAAGGFTHAGNVAAGAIARWNGSTWSAVGAGLNQVPGSQATVHALAVYDDGSGGGPQLYAGGQLTTGPATGAGLAKWDGNTWTPVPSSPCCYLGVQAMVVHDDGSGPELFVGGNFLTGGSRNIVKWNGTTWSGLGSGAGGNILASFVSALAVHDEGSGPRLFAGGNFHEAGGVSATNVARWDGTSWSAMGGGLGGGNPQYVYALAVHDDGSGPILHAAGGFILGASVGGAWWDGNNWQPLGTGPGQGTRALISWDDGTGPALYAAHTSVKRWNGTTWTSIGTFTNGSPLDFASFDSGSGPALYVGGNFLRIDGKTSTHMARWSASVNGTLYCLGDGTGAFCPCGNASTPAERAGCMNPFGTGGALRATGCAHVTSDDVVLHGTGMTNGAALYLQGSSTIGVGAGAPFGDGLRCAGGSVIRLATVANAAGASSYPNTVQTTPISVRGMIPVAGATRFYQAWYRVAAPLCASGGWNLTNGVAIAWDP